MRVAYQWLLALLSTPPARVLLYIDPSAERTTLLPAADLRGVECVRLWSPPASERLVRNLGEDSEEAEGVRAATAPAPGEEEAWARDYLKGETVLGVLCASDGGLATAERLAHVLAPDASNGLLSARRDKFAMGERLRDAGLLVAAQAAPATWSEAEVFLRSQPQPLRVVLKPRRGQASVMVGLATSIGQAERMFRALGQATVSIDASAADGARQALIQELLVGDEWVVDTVSGGGVHKAVALWRYDKGAANGAPFCYFGIEMRRAHGEVERALLQYAFEALDALEWAYGPAHLELMVTEEGVQLIEANVGRWNGENFELMTALAIGYDVRRPLKLTHSECTTATVRPPCDLRRRVACPWLSGFACIPPVTGVRRHAGRVHRPSCLCGAAHDPSRRAALAVPRKALQACQPRWRPADQAQPRRGARGHAIASAV
jgi:hypothetical protein